MLDLGLLDYIFIGLILLGGALGFLRGILKQLYMLSAFLLSFLASIVLSLPVTLWTGQHLHFMKDQFLIVFLILFLLLMGILILVLKWVVPRNKESKPNWKSRIIGFIFGFIQGFLYIALLSWILMQQSWFAPEKLFSGVQKFYPSIVELLLFFTRFYQ